MEHEDIKSDLESLRKLYGHLQSLKIGSQSASECKLDEKAHILFKDLLDGASEKLFGAHSEFMAAQLDVSEVPTSQLENLKATPMARPPVSPHMSEPFPGVSQNITCNSVTADDVEQKIVKLNAFVFGSENPNFDNGNRKPVKRRRYYRVPQKIHLEESKSKETKKDDFQKVRDLSNKHLNESSPSPWNQSQQKRMILADTTNINDTQNLDCSVSVFRNEGDVKSEARSDIVRKIEKKNEETESILNQISSTIDIIDSHLLALKLVADPIMEEQSTVNHVRSIQAKNALPSIDDMQSKQVISNVWDYKDMNLVSHCHIIKPIETRTPGSNIKLRESTGKMMTRSLTNNNSKECQEGSTELKEPFKENQVDGRNVKAMVQKIESMSRLASQNQLTTSNDCKYVRGMRVSASPSNAATVTPLHRQTGKEFQHQLLMPQNDLNVGTSLSSMTNKTHYRYTASPILYGNGRGKREGGDLEDKKSKANQKKILPYRLDLEEESSSSAASSSWTSQQARPSTSGNDSEEYSISDTPSYDYIRPNKYTDTDSESNSFLSETRGYENSRSSSGNDVDSSESTDEQNEDLDGYSESLSVGSVSNNRSSNSIKAKKQTGRFKKLKDKLGLIFHHHHHHHHHHHDHGVKTTRGRSLWKNAGMIFQGLGRTEKHKEKVAEEDVKSLVNKVHKKKQNENFHSLVKGAFKHVKNSKNPNLPKVDVKGATSQHGGKKGAQKLRWWQMLQQQRAVSRPNKANVKLGVGTKEPRLRALPSLMGDDGKG